MNIGIVIADEFEYEPFLNFAKTKNCKEAEFHGRKSVSYTENEMNITAVMCGIGKVNAATATAFLIADKKADIILNAGLSGAVSGLYRGDTVVAESCVECDFDLTAINYPMGQKPGQEYIYKTDKTLYDTAMSIDGIKSAKLGTGDLFLSDKEKAKLYNETFGINAFDMETGAIASVCFFDNIPFLSIRKLSDNADDTANDDYHEMNNRKEMDLTIVIDSLIQKLKK